MLKISCISDTHCNHSKLVIEPCNILLHAGDYSSMGRISETKAFLEWFSNQPATHKIFIDGNHDGLSQDNPSIFDSLLEEYPGVTYLRNEMAIVEGLKIWGRAITPTFGNWWHMADRGSPMMKSSLEIIPEGIDILLTHGPALGILDRTAHGHNAGCEDMLLELQRIKPRFVVFGHIHEAVGNVIIDGIRYINAAVLNERYRLQNKPTVIEL